MSLLRNVLTKSLSARQANVTTRRRASHAITGYVDEFSVLFYLSHNVDLENRSIVGGSPRSLE